MIQWLDDHPDWVMLAGMVAYALVFLGGAILIWSE